MKISYYTQENPDLPHSGIFLEVVLDESESSLDLGVTEQSGDNLGLSS
jgi:hypothetical protein